MKFLFEEKTVFSSQDMVKVFVFFVAPQTSKLTTSLQTLLQMRKYVFYFTWILLSIKMKLDELMNNISNIFLVQFWSLETSSRPFHYFQKILISWGQFILSSWWLTILITTVLKPQKNEKGWPNNFLNILELFSPSTKKRPKVVNLPFTDETLCLSFWRYKQDKWLLQI